MLSTTSNYGKVPLRFHLAQVEIIIVFSCSGGDGAVHSYYNDVFELYSAR